MYNILIKDVKIYIKSYICRKSFKLYTMLYRLLLLLPFLLLSVLSVGQSVEQALKDYFSEFEKGVLKVSSLRRLQAEADRAGTLKYFERYTADSLEGVRAEAFRLVGSYSLGLQKKEHQEAAIRFLIKGLGDPSSSVSRVAANSLSKFGAPSFSRRDVQELVKQLGSAKEKSALFRLVAYAGDTSVLDTLRRYRNTVLTKEESWSLNLALARSGDSLSSQAVLAVLRQNMGNCTNLVKLLPDFSYTKSRVVVDMLLAAAVADKLECRSPNPSSEVSAPFGFYALPYLSCCIRAFPVAADESGELEDDYSVAAAAVKTWYTSNNGTYQISRSSYR